VTLSLNETDDRRTLSGNPHVTVDNGVATFSDLSIVRRHRLHATRQHRRRPADIDLTFNIT